MSDPLGIMVGVAAATVAQPDTGAWLGHVAARGRARQPLIATSRFVGVTYTGEVEVGGPADIRAIDGLTLAKVAVGPMNNNAYLLRDNATGQGLLIDAAAEAGTLLQLI